MREAPGQTVLVIGNAATIDAVRAAVAPVGFHVEAIAGVDALDAVPTAIRSNAFAVVLDVSKAAAKGLEPRISALLDDDIHCVIVSNDIPPAVPWLGDAPWEAVVSKPIDVGKLREALDMIWEMLDDAHDHPLRPGEEEQLRRDEDQSMELHRLLIADLQRRTLLAETETPEQTHTRDLFEMLFGDDEADDGKVPVAEYQALRAVRWDVDAYLAARARMREYAKKLPEGLRQAARAELTARTRRRS